MNQVIAIFLALSSLPTGGSVEVKVLQATPCSSPEVCALNTDFIVQIVRDGKIILTVPKEIMTLEERKEAFSRLFGRAWGAPTMTGDTMKGKK